MIAEEGYPNQEAWFYEYSDWDDFSIENLNINPPSDSIVPKASIEAKITVNNYASKRGNRLFFKPFLATESRLNKLKPSRQTQFEFRYAFSQNDSIIVNLDQAYRVEKSMLAKKVSSKYGKYESKTIELSATKLLFVRKLTVNKGKYDVNEYQELRAFVEMIIRHDNGLVVLNDRT